MVGKLVIALLLAAALMLAYGCAGNQPGAGFNVNDNEPPPPPPDNSTINLVGINELPPLPPSG